MKTQMKWFCAAHLPWNRYYLKMEFFPHALRLVSECDLNWSFEYLAAIFADALSSLRHCNLHRWAVVPTMAYSMTFDCCCRRMAASVHALDLELAPNNHRYPANCMHCDLSMEMDRTV